MPCYLVELISEVWSQAAGQAVYPLLQGCELTQPCLEVNVLDPEVPSQRVQELGQLPSSRLTFLKQKRYPVNVGDTDSALGKLSGSESGKKSIRFGPATAVLRIRGPGAFLTPRTRDPGKVKFKIREAQNLRSK
jgi:hypothetical protein